MGASRTRRTCTARKRLAKKTGLVALAAAALASPVATTPVVAQSSTAVTPVPEPPNRPAQQIDEEMGTLPPPAPKGAEIPRASPGTEAIGPPCTPKKPSEAIGPPCTPKKPGVATQDQSQQLQTPTLQPQPAAPSAKDKALIYTGPGKPTR